METDQSLFLFTKSQIAYSFLHARVAWIFLALGNTASRFPFLNIQLHLKFDTEIKTEHDIIIEKFYVPRGSITHNKQFKYI